MKPTKVLTLLAAILIVVAVFNTPAFSGGPYEDHPWDQEDNDPNTGESGLIPGDSVEVTAFNGELLRGSEHQRLSIPLRFYNLYFIVIVSDFVELDYSKGDNSVVGEALSDQ